MDLSQLRSGMTVMLEMMPESKLKQRLQQFGLTEQMEVTCISARSGILALSWQGTTVAIRRKDVAGIGCRVRE